MDRGNPNPGAPLHPTGASSIAGGTQQQTTAFNQPSLPENGGVPLVSPGYRAVNEQPLYTSHGYLQPQQQASTSIIQQQQGPRQRRLQVDDALSYLEQVRQQFSSQPDVYNDFLEVMKEFKSHAIDTQGVIRRVSRLFSGHPGLINGFNTFLPPGFEVSVTGSFVRIVEPNGENTFVNNASGELITQRDMAVILQTIQQNAPGVKVELAQGAALAAGGHVDQMTTNILHVAAPHSEMRHASPQTELKSQALESLSRSAANHQQIQQQQQQLPQPPPQYSLPAMASQPSPPQQQQPIHFDQAVGYLNKIKERFANRPEVYKEFLSILGKYQKLTSEGNKCSMSETAEVYDAVARLFRNEEDLMRDFKVDDLDRDFGSEVDRAVQSERRQSASAESTFKPAKKRPGDGSSPVVKKAKTAKDDTYHPSVRDCLEDVPLKDLIFFEKVQKALRSEVVVRNFFRSLVLYNKSLVSRRELLELTSPFLSPFPDLMKQFHDILGVGSRGRSPNRLQRVENRFSSEVASQIDFATCRRLGVSYRSVPGTYNQAKCSGRTSLCKSVLNDTWVSFPSWSSEDSSTVSSKKSAYEDFMYRTEDERFEVDILIEVNSAAIKSMEYVRKKIESMGNDEAKKFVLETNFGSSSPTLLSRAVKKLYGEHATKVFEGMKDNPLVAVPQVLKRLKEKDTEWRSTRKAFVAIWRDQIDKNYNKSLDHQAAHFKANDIKFLRSKALLQQLENCYDERQAQIEKDGVPEVGPHLLLEYPDSTASVTHDVNELLIHYVRRQQNISKKEKFTIKSHLRRLIPRLFNIQAECMSDDEEEEEEDDEEEATANGSSDRSEGSDVEGEEGTRRLTRASKKRDSSKKRHSSKKGQSIGELPPSSKDGYTLFYSTNSWILFIRLHHIICERLAVMKKCAEELREEYAFEMLVRERQSKLYEKHGRAAPPEENAVDVHLGLRELKKPLLNPKDFYQTLIQELKNTLDGITEFATFEDTLRNMFGTNAYLMFTMDKLISTMARQLQVFVADEASSNSVTLFDKYCVHKAAEELGAAQSPPDSLPANELYEIGAEKLMVHDNCYKVFFVHTPKPVVAVELIATEASSDEDDEVGDETDEERDSRRVVKLSKWWDYVRRYASDSGDEENAEVDSVTKRPLFLARNVHYRRSLLSSTFNFNFFSFSSPPPSSDEAGAQLQFVVNSGLRAVLASSNPRLLYEEGTCDVVIRIGRGVDNKELAERRHSRLEEWVSSRNGVGEDSEHLSINELFHHQPR